MSLRKSLIIVFGITVIFIWLSACSKISPVPMNTLVVGSPTVTLTPAKLPSSTPVTPTATPIPLAAVVNGEGITLAEFQAEVERFQASIAITGTNLVTDTNTMVLNELVDQTLLAQAASENGFLVDESVLQTRISALETQLGSPQALEQWESSHGYTPEDFAQALKRSVAAAWMRDQIIAGVPDTADQVHVVQILLPTIDEANQVYSSLQSGEDFLDLASEQDPLTHGDLGWFPKGYLNEPVIDEAAFALQPGEFSTVIQTEIGYHILYLVERDATHPLLPDAKRVLQENALQAWLVDRRDNSEIQILVP